MRLTIVFLTVAVIALSGCIKHSNQPIRKNGRQKQIENRTSFGSISPRLLTDDVNKTVEFYRANFGFETAGTVPDTGKFNLAILYNGKTEITFLSRMRFTEEYGIYKDAASGGTFALSIETPEVVRLYETAGTKAVIVRELHQTFYGTKEFSVKDNNGYILTFVEPVKK